jgi:hypothetical protein
MTMHKDFQYMFTLSFIKSTSREGYKCECCNYFFSVKENVGKLELEVINLQTDLSLKTSVNNTDFWNLAMSAQWPLLKQVECMFHF